MRISDWSSDVCSSDLGGPGELLDRARLGGDAVGVEYLHDLAAYLLLVQALEVELQAGRQHRHQQLLGVGGREQELDVLRRLLERLEQRVERRLRQHVHFVDQVHLVPAARGHVLRVFDQVADVVDAGVGGRVVLQQVDVAAGVDRQEIGKAAGRGRGGQ